MCLRSSEAVPDIGGPSERLDVYATHTPTSLFLVALKHLRVQKYRGTMRRYINNHGLGAGHGFMAATPLR
jgi:hypothetical protein